MATRRPPWAARATCTDRYSRFAEFTGPEIIDSRELRASQVAEKPATCSLLEIHPEAELDAARTRVAVVCRGLPERRGPEVALRRVQVHMVGDIERLGEELDAIDFRGRERQHLRDAQVRFEVARAKREVARQVADASREVRVVGGRQKRVAVRI